MVPSDRAEYADGDGSEGDSRKWICQYCGFKVYESQFWAIDEDGQLGHRDCIDSREEGDHGE